MSLHTLVEDILQVHYGVTLEDGPPMPVDGYGAEYITYKIPIYRKDGEVILDDGTVAERTAAYLVRKCTVLSHPLRHVVFRRQCAALTHPGTGMVYVTMRCTLYTQQPGNNVVKFNPASQETKRIDQETTLLDTGVQDTQPWYPNPNSEQWINPGNQLGVALQQQEVLPEAVIQEILANPVGQFVEPQAVVGPVWMIGR